MNSIRRLVIEGATTPSQLQHQEEAPKVELLTINKHCREVTRIFFPVFYFFFFLFQKNNKSLLSNRINLKRASRLKSRTPSLRVVLSCMWLGHTCVPTTPLFSYSVKYSVICSIHNQRRAPEKVESDLLQKRPGGQIQADRHTNSAIFSNTQRIFDTRSTMSTKQRAICRTMEDQAARPHYQRNAEIILMLQVCNPYGSLL